MCTTPERDDGRIGRLTIIFTIFNGASSSSNLVMIITPRLGPTTTSSHRKKALPANGQKHDSF
jgi:hypothetical protein